MPVSSIVAPAASTDGDDLGVAHRAARLGERGDAGLEADLDRVGEREERVRGARRAGERRIAGIRQRLAPPRRGPRPRARSGPSPSRSAAGRGRGRSRSRRRPRHEPPGEVEVQALRVGRGRARGDGPGRRVVGGRVGRRHEHGAAGRPDRAESGPAAALRLVVGERRVHDEPQVGLGGRGSSRASGSKAGRDDDLEEDRGEGRRPSAASTGRVSATTPPNADTGSPASAASHASSERRALGRPARVRVLDDDAGRATQRAPERGRRRRVEDVVVRQGLALERRRIGRERAVVDGRARAAGSGRRAGAGSRRSGAPRPSRARPSGWPDTDPRSGQAGLVRQRDAGRRHPARQDLGDPRVVGGGVAEGLDGQGAIAGRRRRRRRRRAPRRIAS